MAVVFVESKHILPEDMTNAVEEYSFARLPVAKGEKDATEKIVSSMYKNNMQIRKKKIFLPFIKSIPHCYGFLIRLVTIDD